MQWKYKFLVVYGKLLLIYHVDYHILGKNSRGKKDCFIVAVFLRILSGRVVKLIAQLHLVQSWRIHGALPLLALHNFMVLCVGIQRNFPFYLACYSKTAIYHILQRLNN
jgi:hypothetical protein